MKTSQTTKSVYSEHKELCTRFQDAEVRFKELNAKLRASKEELAMLNAEPADQADWGKIVDCKDRIIGLKQDLVGMKVENDEIDYYKNASPILFKYYNTFEASDSSNVTRTGSKTSKKSILNFLNNKTNVDEQDEQSQDNRGTLYEKYMEMVNKDYIKTYPDENIDVCPHCQFKCRQVIANEGVVHCPQCLCVERVIMEVDKPSYKEPPSEVTYYQYRRGNHYNEWINQIQGKEYTDIPNDVIDAILVELNRQKVTNMAALTPLKVRGILRKLKLTKYYEHVAFILYKLSGVPPARLGEETEEKLRQMFDAVQGPFLRHAPKDRTNFLSYGYVLRKFLEMLGKHEFLQFFPLQKSRDKVWMCEMTWRKICDELGWPFIRSIWTLFFLFLNRLSWEAN